MRCIRSLAGDRESPGTLSLKFGGGSDLTSAGSEKTASPPGAHKRKLYAQGARCTLARGKVAQRVRLRTEVPGRWRLRSLAQ